MFSMCCTQYGTTLKVFIFARWPYRFLLCFSLSILPAVRCSFLRCLLHRQRLAGLFCKAWYVTEWSRQRIAIATGREDSFIFRRGRKHSFLPFLRSETLMRVCVCVTSALHHDEVHTRKRWMMVGRSGRKLDLAKVKKREDILSPHSSCKTNPYPAMKVFSLSAYKVVSWSSNKCLQQRPNIISFMMPRISLEQGALYSPPAVYVRHLSRYEIL